MSRRILILSTVLLLAGVVVMLYADPLARLTLGFSPTGSSFVSSVTRTFTFANRTITANPGAGGFGGAFGGGLGGRAVNTTGTVETLVAIGLIGVGLVLEVMTVFLWQGKPKPAPPTAV